MTGHEIAETADVSPDDVAFWLYSSGSTGQPKGVTHVHRSLAATADTYGTNVFGVQEDDLVYSAAKIFFAYGLGNAMTFPMSVGATTLLFAGRPTPDGVIDILASHRPTLFCGVPTLFSAMLAQLEGGAKADFALRLCISAGEALPEATVLAGMPRQVSTFWMVLAQPRCCTSSCQTAKAMCLWHQRCGRARL